MKRMVLCKLMELCVSWEARCHFVPNLSISEIGYKKLDPLAARKPVLVSHELGIYRDYSRMQRKHLPDRKSCDLAIHKVGTFMTLCSQEVLN
jgi:hypothetical protein